MANRTTKYLQRTLKDQLTLMKETGTYKGERIIKSPQSSSILSNNKKVLNFCANNYLGLSNHPRLIEAAKKTLDTHGFGMSSVRFICGTQDIHK
jgi:glycine C-acetyltransferase